MAVAGTDIWINFWGLHHDEKLWHKPGIFDPSRFLDDTGHMVPADHPNRMNLLPFGAGSRICVGKVVSRVISYFFCSKFINSLLFVFRFCIFKFKVSFLKQRLNGH